MEIVAVKSDDGLVSLFQFSDRQAAESFAAVMTENGYEYAITTVPDEERK